MSWKKDTDMLKKIQNETITCQCGHRIRMTGRCKKLECNWCHRMVYFDKQEQKKNEFKNKMRSILNENNKYSNSTI